jgi:hypothetical protein
VSAQGVLDRAVLDGGRSKTGSIASGLSNVWRRLNTCKINQSECCQNRRRANAKRRD